VSFGSECIGQQQSYLQQPDRPLTELQTITARETFGDSGLPQAIAIDLGGLAAPPSTSAGTRRSSVWPRSSWTASPNAAGPLAISSTGFVHSVTPVDGDLLRIVATEMLDDTGVTILYGA
jgi:hypothetical protein